MRTLAGIVAYFRIFIMSPVTRDHFPPQNHVTNIHLVFLGYWDYVCDCCQFITTTASMLRLHKKGAAANSFTAVTATSVLTTFTVFTETKSAAQVLSQTLILEPLVPNQNQKWTHEEQKFTKLTKGE